MLYPISHDETKHIKANHLFVFLLAVVSFASSAEAGSIESQRVSTVVNMDQVQRMPASIGPGASLATPSKVFWGQMDEPLAPDLIAIYHSVKEQEAQEQHFQTGDIIPTSLAPTGDIKQVVNQIADRSTNTLFHSKSFRESAVGQTTTKVENSLKKEVVIGGHEPQSVQHKVNFNLEAFQSIARIQYTGYANAAVTYKIAEEKLGVEVSESVGRQQDLIVSHQVSPLDRFSQLSMRWSF